MAADPHLERAVVRALVVLRYIAGHQKFCAACFCEAVADQLLDIAETLPHGGHLAPMPEAEYRSLMKNPSAGGVSDFLFVEPEGNA